MGDDYVMTEDVQHGIDVQKASNQFMMFGACFLSGQRALFEGVTEKIFLTVKIFPEEIEVNMSKITTCTEIMNFATHS